MSKKISISRNDVMNSQDAKIEEILNEFSVDEHRSYLKLCKQNSEVYFRCKNLQILDSFNKMGKSMVYVSRIIFKIFN